MSRPLLRTRSAPVRATVLAAAALSCALVVAGPASAGPDAGHSHVTRPAAVTGHPAGPIGSAVTVAHAQDLPGGHPFDLVTADDGTTYFGWIGDNAGGNQERGLHLCTLPPGATACRGGVQTLAIDDAGSADELYLLPSNGGPTLYWFHNTPAAENGPEGGEIAEAYAPGGHLSASSDVFPAPSNGDLLDAESAPGTGNVWTVEYAGVGTRTLQVKSSQIDSTVHAPFNVGAAQLAFTRDGAILAVAKYGAVSTPVSYAYRPNNGTWSSFSKVADTWTTGGLTLKRTGHGVRLVTGVDNASYHPVIAAWNGSGFDRRRPTADTNNCGPTSHDGATDASGRLVDASWECNDVTVTNYADGRRAAIVRIKVGGTPTNTPQIGENARGVASVAWSVEDPKGGSVLRVSRVRLGTASRVVSHHVRAGTVHVTGPVSCLPVSNALVRVSGHPSHGWKVVRHSLTLGSQAVTGSHVDGSTLDPHKSYTLHGTAVFGKGSERSEASAALTFSTC